MFFYKHVKNEGCKNTIKSTIDNVFIDFLFGHLYYVICKIILVRKDYKAFYYLEIFYIIVECTYIITYI